MSDFQYKVVRVHVKRSSGESAETKSNSHGLAAAMEKILNEQAADRWRVVSCVPVLRGVRKTAEGHDHIPLSKAPSTTDYGYGWGYGYSMTDAVVVVLERPAK